MTPPENPMKYGSKKPIRNNKTNRWETPKGPMLGKRTWNDTLSQRNPKRAVKNARPTTESVKSKGAKGYTKKLKRAQAVHKRRVPKASSRAVKKSKGYA